MNNKEYALCMSTAQRYDIEMLSNVINVYVYFKFNNWLIL